VHDLGATVVWRTAPDRGDLLPLMHSHHRRAARKADRAGVEIRITENPPELTAFRTCYDATMRRQDAAPYYFFRDAYWDALVRTRGGGTMVLVDALLEGELAASLLCIAGGGALHYHLGASTDAARAVGASNRCFLAAASWAQEAGIGQFHLGGGVGGGEGSTLLQFKHRFDPESELARFHIAKIVHDASAYEELAGTTSTDGFFPPWRSLA
jgi:lipid II:glycine glycyltransferase (peptidoglycan interpeptide bridge formation enzyme)